MAVAGGDDDLLCQAHDGLEEVVVAAHLLVELMEQLCLGHGVQAFMAQISADQGAVLLLHEGVVVLVIGSGSGQLYVASSLSPEAQQVVVEELTAVVGMDLLDFEGQLSENVAEGYRS